VNPKNFAECVLLESMALATSKARIPAPSWCGNEYPPQGGAGRLSRRCYSGVQRGNELPNGAPKSKKRFSVTAYLGNNCSSSLPALDRNCLCVVKVPSVMANASLSGRPNLGLSCMTLGDKLEYLHHTQIISVKCRQTTRAVIIYIGCDRKLLFRFSVFCLSVQSSELYWILTAKVRRDLLESQKKYMKNKYSK